MTFTKLTPPAKQTAIKMVFDLISFEFALENGYECLSALENDPYVMSNYVYNKDGTLTETSVILHKHEFDLDVMFNSYPDLYSKVIGY